MPLKEVVCEIKWPSVHIVYVEKTGPFEEVGPKCWAEFKASKALISEDPHHFLQHLSLFKAHSAMRYCAGATVASAPTEPLPPGVEYMELEAGKYLQYTVTGSHDHMYEACQTVLQRVEDGGIVERGGWFIEQRVNNHETTPDDELITHILAPIPDHL